MGLGRREGSEEARYLVLGGGLGMGWEGWGGSR